MVVTVFRQYDENCVKWVDGEPTSISWNALGATLAVWIIIFLCVFKGVKSSSYIVWITVPVPVLFVFIMIINGTGLEGSEKGIEKYFSGDLDGTLKKTTMAEIWSDAAG